MEEEGEKPEEAPASVRPPATAQPALGGWRGPALWMGCGATLAGLVFGSVLLAQRVDVERDMAAVAVMLPAPVTAPAEPGSPALPVPAQAGPLTTPVPDAAASATPAPLAPPGASASLAAATPVVQGAAPGAAAVEPPGKVRTVRAVKPRALAARPPYATKQSARQTRKVAARTKSNPGVRRKAAQEHSLYWEVFKRCPLPGEPGAVECRRHICNGAEREGPACKAYRRRR